jgi:hypothetical protein
MSFASLRVIKPESRLIYINGNYADPAGHSSTDSITVASGGNIAETLNDENKVDYRKQFEVRPGDTVVVIALDPVNPPEAI